MEYTNLFSEGNIGKLKIKNRIVLPALATGMANFDGTPSEQLIKYYEERAKSGTGIIITEITRVNDLHGATMARQLSMSKDKYIAPFSEFVDRIHNSGARLFCQLHHPGRQNLSVMVLFWPFLQLTGRIFPRFWNIFPKMVPFALSFMEKIWAPRVVAPSRVVCSYSKQRTRALKKREIKKLVNDFGDGAQRVKKSGGDGVEIHAAHGYLIQQFLSPRTNKRSDEYGGSIDKRMRFIKEIIEDIKTKCGNDFPIIVRLTVDEFYQEIGETDYGITLEDGIYIAKELEKAGIHALNVSSASYETLNYWLEPISFVPGWRKYLSAAIKNVVNIPVIGASVIRTPEQADEQIKEGSQDFVALGRAQVADPQWTSKAEHGSPEKIKRCISCLNCFYSLNENGKAGMPFECSINPELGFEGERRSIPVDGDGKTIVIIGAGPSGLSAAEILSLRGFKVIIFEKETKVGGQLRLAEKPPFKGKISWTYEDLLNSVTVKNVDIRYNHEPSIEDIRELKPYAIISAIGGVTMMPPVKGIDSPNVISYVDILNKIIVPKKMNITVIGSGMSGLETAEKLSEFGNKLTIVEMQEEIGPGLFKLNLDDILSRLNRSNPVYKTGRKLIEVKKDSFLLENIKTGEVEECQTGFIVIATGVRSNIKFTDELLKEFNNVKVIGDAKKTGRIFDAIHDGYKTGRDI